MDRGNAANLEALAEEEDDFDNKHSDTESSQDSDDEPDPGIRSLEPNKFDILCDGVQGSMALVHTSLEEFLEMKNELLNHSIPPTVLVKLITTAGKVFRSLSDLNMPVNELLRLVRVYSTPWEEKSAALKKLHEDYESKQRQLNIAIKRLQLVDAHSKRIAKEKRVMNWEKLFSKLTSAKGHGRRWKFLIEAIKQKAKMGLEHVQEYTRALEESSESEEEEEDDEIKTGVARTSISDEDSDEDEEEKEEEKEDATSVSDTTSVQMGQEVPNITINITQDTDEASDDNSSRAGSAKRVRFEDEKTPVIPKPLMIEQSCWTSEPEYEEYLNVRVYQPTGLKNSDIKCILKYGDQVLKTKKLDVMSDDKEEITESSKDIKDETKQATSSEKPPEAIQKKWYEELQLNTPLGLYQGTIDIKKLKPEKQHIQISVHHGLFEDMFAMATIDLADIQALNLRTVYAKAPTGDDHVLADSYKESLLDDSFSDDMDLPGFQDAQTDSESKEDDPVKDIDPLPFPLYPLQASKGNSMHEPCGNLPLLFYWGRRLKPKTFNRQIETHDITDVVFDLTGIDLRITTKEDLHKEMVERAASAIQFTPEPEVLEEEMIPKMDYDSLVDQHETEVKDLKTHYESQMKELMNNIQDLQQKFEQHLDDRRGKHSNDSRRVSLTSISHKSNSAGSYRSASKTPPKSASSRMSDKMTLTLSPRSAPLDPSERELTPEFYSVPPPVLRSPVPPPNERVKKNFRIGRPLPKWGESLPEDFFERLKLFEEESKIHKRELNEKTLLEIRETLERKLADQHRLSKKEEAMYDALKDVSLPALFMPTKLGNIYNPRAHQYFHPTGSSDARLTQPPSVFQLPPLPKSKMSVVNLFDLGKTFHSKGPPVLADRYSQPQQTYSAIAEPMAPAPTEIRPHTMPHSMAEMDARVDMTEHYSDEAASPHSIPDNLSSVHEQEVHIQS